MMKPRVVDLGSLEHGNAFRHLQDAQPFVVVGISDVSSIGISDTENLVLAVMLNGGILVHLSKETQVVRIQIGVQIQDVVDTEIVDV